MFNPRYFIDDRIGTILITHDGTGFGSPYRETTREECDASWDRQQKQLRTSAEVDANGRPLRWSGPVGPARHG